MSPPGRASSGGAVLAFVACSLIWGSTFLVIRIGNEALPPLWAAAVRLAIASLLLLVLTRLLSQPLPRGAALRGAMGLGFWNFGLSFSLLYWAEQRLPSALAAILYATIPLTTALLARAHGLEALSWAKVAGAVVAFAGVAVIFWDTVTSASGSAPPGSMLAVWVASVCAAYAGIGLKRAPPHPPLPVNAVAAIVGCGVCLAGSLLLGEPRPLPRSAAAIAPLLYLAVVGSIGAFGLYAWLVQKWPLSRISFIAVIVPVVAVVLGAAVRSERLGSRTLTGSALVLAGLGIALAGDRAPGPQRPLESLGAPPRQQAPDREQPVP